jgi:hypothetical protein
VHSCLSTPALSNITFLMSFCDLYHVLSLASVVVSYCYMLFQEGFDGDEMSGPGHEKSHGITA